MRLLFDKSDVQLIAVIRCATMSSQLFVCINLLLGNA